MRELHPSRTIWLVQRYSPGTGFINPFGDMNGQIGNEVAQKLIADVVSPDYMGAAEYEWGAYPKCLEKMFEHELVVEEYDGFDIPIYIVAASIDFAKVCIHYLYNETELVNSYSDNSYNEVSKADYGSFKKTVLGKSRQDTIGWLSLKGHYAWFTDENIAKTFKQLLTPDEWKEIAEAIEEETECQE